MKTEKEVKDRMLEILWELKHMPSRQTHARRMLVKEYNVLTWVTAYYGYYSEVI